MISAGIVFSENFTARNFNSSPLTISDLQGDLYDYELVAIFDYSSASADNLRVQSNLDTTANYRSYRMRGFSTTANASVSESATSIELGTLKSGTISFTKFRITGSAGDERYIDNMSSGENSVATDIKKISGYWKNTANEITSLTLETGSANSDAHIMLYRTPKISGQSSWELMKTETLSSLNIAVGGNDLQFTGLDGDSDIEYKLSYDLESAATERIVLRMNDLGTSIYTLQRLYNIGGSIISQNVSNPELRFTSANSGLLHRGDIIVKAESGVKRLVTASLSSATTSNDQAESAGWIDNTADNMTSLQFATLNGSLMTGIVKLYRRRNPAGTGDTLPFEVIKTVDISGDFSAGHDFTDLLGDSVNMYKLEFLGEFSTSSRIRVQINGDTASNYTRQFLRGASSTVSAASSTNAYMEMVGSTDAQSTGVLYLYPRSGATRPALSSSGYKEDSISRDGFWWDNSADEITSLKVFASNTNSITGKLTLSRLVGKPPSYIANPLHFDGTNDLITMPDDSVFEFGSSDFTLSMQLTWRAEPFSYIFNRVESGSIYVQMYILSDGSGIRVVPSGMGTFTVPFSSSLVNGNTYQIILRRSGNDMNAYVDSVAGATHDATGLSIAAITAVTEVGASTFDSRYDDFDIANWVVFNEAITAGDITELQRLKQLDDYSSALRAKYGCALPLNDRHSDPFDDLSSNGLDATAVGGVGLTGGTAMEFFN